MVVPLQVTSEALNSENKNHGTKALAIELGTLASEGPDTLLLRNLDSKAILGVLISCTGCRYFWIKESRPNSVVDIAFRHYPDHGRIQKVDPPKF